LRMFGGSATALTAPPATAAAEPSSRRRDTLGPALTCGSPGVPGTR
jgi:hypothetical protein